jgi:excisionase family DNA binding protein
VSDAQSAHRTTTNESLATIHSRFAYTIPKAAELCSISRSQVYVELQSGRLTAIKVGGRTLVRHDDLLSWLRSRPQRSATKRSEA